jgi:uncharacterized protein (DUF2141 family)
MKNLIALFAFLVFSTALFAQQTQSLRIMVDRIPEAESSTLVMLYGPGTQLLNESAEPLAQQTIPAGQTRASVDFEGLSSGAFYAVVVFQDLNGNGMLDRRNGRPAEPYAYTNNPSFIGTPSFSDLAVRLNPETSALLLQMVQVKVKGRDSAVMSAR